MTIDKQQKEPASNPSGDPFKSDETKCQLATVPSASNRLHEADADSKTVKTRVDALQGALTIDSQESGKATDRSTRLPAKDKAIEAAQPHLEPTLPAPTPFSS